MVVLVLTDGMTLKEGFAHIDSIELTDGLALTDGMSDLR
jgi:hypothetical protein